MVDKLNRFIEWFRKEGGYNTEDNFSKLEIRKFEEYGYGVACKDNEEIKLNKNEILLKISSNLFLSYANLKKKCPNFIKLLDHDDRLINEIVENGICIGNTNLEPSKKTIEEAVLTLFLVYCKNNKEIEHYWKPYTDLLIEMSTQGALREMKKWEESEDVKNNCLYVFIVIKAIMSRMEESNKRYFFSLEEEMDKSPEEKKISELGYVWAYSIILTRASNPIIDSSRQILGNTFLVPFFDFFNHCNTDHFKIFYDSENYDLFLSADNLSKGEEQILIRPKEQIFTYYGKDLYAYGKLN